MRLTRRHLLAGLAALPLAATARAQSLDGTSLNLTPGSTEDQSGPLQDALLRASAEGRPLFLPAGSYLVQNLQVPGSLVVTGVPGATILAAAGEAPVARITGSANVLFENIAFSGGNGGPVDEQAGLLEIEASERIRLDRCTFLGGKAHGIAVNDAAADITECDFSGHGRSALFGRDSRGLLFSGNRISGCGNGGVRIWGTRSRHDGSVIRGNIIAGIGASKGGSGQNGNGINVFRADDVIIAGNQITDCSFSAIRLNASNNVAVTGNVCRNSGEVAIFSGFGFSGSVIADNIVDGAATGISISHLDTGGHLATCSGNIVRNIRERSEVNPDTRPIGIYVEAETTVIGNSIEAVPGYGIRAGNGPYLRHVVIVDNVVRASKVGIGISVVSDPPPGPISVSGNLVAEALEHSIVGLEGDRIVSDDLIRDAARYPLVSLSGNTAG